MKFVECLFFVGFTCISHSNDSQANKRSSNRRVLNPMLELVADFRRPRIEHTRPSTTHGAARPSNPSEVELLNERFMKNFKPQVSQDACKLSSTRLSISEHLFTKLADHLNTDSTCLVLIVHHHSQHQIKT